MFETTRIDLFELLLKTKISFQNKKFIEDRGKHGKLFKCYKVLKLKMQINAFFPYPDHLYSDSNEKKPGQRATLKATSS